MAAGKMCTGDMIVAYRNAGLLERLGFPNEAADLRRLIHRLREKFGMEFMN